MPAIGFPGAIVETLVLVFILSGLCVVRLEIGADYGVAGACRVEI